MKQLTREWIVKAEGDFALVKREARVRASPNYDAVCFHAQQCAEKYLKARLCEARLEFPKTHDLNALLDIIIPLESRWELYRPDLVFLTDFAVSFRYPGESADRAASKKALASCGRFRSAVRESLRLRPKN